MKQEDNNCENRRGKIIEEIRERSLGALKEYYCSKESRARRREREIFIHSYENINPHEMKIKTGKLSFRMIISLLLFFSISSGFLQKSRRNEILSMPKELKIEYSAWSCSEFLSIDMIMKSHNLERRHFLDRHGNVLPTHLIKVTVSLRLELESHCHQSSSSSSV